MAPGPRRKFTIADALALVAAVAVGVAWTRHYFGTEAGGESYPYPEEYLLGHPGPPLDRIPAWFGLLVAAWWAEALFHVLTTVTLALVALRFVGPRPKRRRLARQPGAVACLAALGAVAVELASLVPEAVASYLHGPGIPWYQHGYWDMTGPPEALAVAVAWLLLAAVGRRRGATDWIEWAGRVVGAAWLVLPPLIWAIRCIPPFL